MKIKVYHNPRCKKSRAGLQYLEQKSSEPEIIDYLKNGLTTDEVEKLIKLLGVTPLEIVRTQEEYYKKELKGREIPDEKWPLIIAQNPKLLKRPVVIKEDKAVIGDPATNIDILFK